MDSAFGPHPPREPQSPCLSSATSPFFRDRAHDGLRAQQLGSLFADRGRGAEGRVRVGAQLARAASATRLAAVRQTHKRPTRRGKPENPRGKAGRSAPEKERKEDVSREMKGWKGGKGECCEKGAAGDPQTPRIRRRAPARAVAEQAAQKAVKARRPSFAKLNRVSRASTPSAACRTENAAAHAEAENMGARATADAHARNPPQRRAHLVLVESPAKARTIAKFLEAETDGAVFHVRATKGHVRQLKRTLGAVQVGEETVSFTWEPVEGPPVPLARASAAAPASSPSVASTPTSRPSARAPAAVTDTVGDGETGAGGDTSNASKRRRRKAESDGLTKGSEDASFLLRTLREVLDDVGCIDTLFLCTDPDREGEAISWHIYESLKRQQEAETSAVSSPDAALPPPSSRSLLSRIGSVCRVRLLELTEAAVRQAILGKTAAGDAADSDGAERDADPERAREAGDPQRGRHANSEAENEARGEAQPKLADDEALDIARCKLGREDRPEERGEDEVKLQGLDADLVRAYLARLAIDFLAGFSLSPLLWRKLPGSKSAGRVQSAALKLLADREAAVEAFRPRAFASVHAQVTLVCGARRRPTGPADALSEGGADADGDAGPRRRPQGRGAEDGRRGGKAPTHVTLNMTLTRFKGKPFVPSTAPASGPSASPSLPSSPDGGSALGSGSAAALPPQRPNELAAPEETLRRDAGIDPDSQGAGGGTSSEPLKKEGDGRGEPRDAEAAAETRKGTGCGRNEEARAMNRGGESNAETAADEDGREGLAEETRKVLEALREMQFNRGRVAVSYSFLSPPAPFRTATLQQAAARLLGFSPAATMRLAQALYEGVGGLGGLITYMRTDSSRLSAAARADVRRFVASAFPPEFLRPEDAEGGEDEGTEAGRRAEGDALKPHRRRNSKTEAPRFAQEAHEAIRPTDVSLRPEDLRRSLTARASDAKQEDRGAVAVDAEAPGGLTDAHLALYELIWRRAVASQMSPAVRQSLRLALTAAPRSADAAEEPSAALAPDAAASEGGDAEGDEGDGDAPGEPQTRRRAARGKSQRGEGAEASDTRLEAEVRRVAFEGYLSVYDFASAQAALRRTAAAATPQEASAHESQSEEGDPQDDDGDHEGEQETRPTSEAGAGDATRSASSEIFAFFEAAPGVAHVFHPRDSRSSAGSYPACASSFSLDSLCSISPGSPCSLASPSAARPPVAPVESEVGLPVLSGALEFYALQHFTRPPPRFSEASLIDALERLGIGRPSTYASVIASLYDRAYVYPRASQGSAHAPRQPAPSSAAPPGSPRARHGRRRGALVPSPRGRLVSAFLEASVPTFVSAAFTARLEEALDAVAGRRGDWVAVVQTVWSQLKENIEKSEKIPPKQIRDALEQTLATMIFGDAAPASHEPQNEEKASQKLEATPEAARANQTTSSHDARGPGANPTAGGADEPGDSESKDRTQNTGNQRHASHASRAQPAAGEVSSSQNAAHVVAPSRTTSASPSCSPASPPQSPLCLSVPKSPSAPSASSPADASAFIAQTSGFRPPPCPGCGEGELKLRVHSRGIFVGCSAYPKCTYIQQVPPLDKAGADPEKSEAEEASVSEGEGPNEAVREE
ncbi:hypothetical protein BESB_028370 [Besnoitia besnoiti]|uniref:DNA topoisomerase n=1 Tax=Besnoitia besnoiti TaxID=94643 RepID=A0A2A9M7R5_BESBE|nr:uncharacterized protein BESB_028370 [Besnoitia besnoiti]PFH31402.1 hypothetical protein BESB_028370 [Besnoitia besnoiti]